MHATVSHSNPTRAAVAAAWHLMPRLRAPRSLPLRGAAGDRCGALMTGLAVPSEVAIGLPAAAIYPKEMSEAIAMLAVRNSHPAGTTACGVLEPVASGRTLTAPLRRR